MSLRTRIAAVASVSVALAVLAVAAGLYVAVRSELRGEVDSALRARARGLSGQGATPPPERGRDGDNSGLGGNPPVGGGPPGEASPGSGPAAGGPMGGGFPGSVEPAPFGAASGYVELISPSGEAFVPGGQGSSRRKIPVTARDRAIAAAGSGSSFSDRSVDGTELRVLTIGTGRAPRQDGVVGAVLVAQPLTEVEHELSQLLLIELLIGVGGVVLAALLGALVARTALAPIGRFTERTETLTGNLDLSHRLEVHGRDELARLADSFNAALDALERSVQAQRHLIADASHELRTPISSLRANIQILGEAERLAPAEQESLRADVVAELDELTALVGDVVELARGAEPDGAADDVRLDELAAAAVASARRRGAGGGEGGGGEVSFELKLEPTVVRGRADRIGRAVSNLVDNARKWSPPGAQVEVSLKDGVLSVRDHGPGFQEADLPFVFDRFYRAHAARGLPGSGLGLAIVRQAAEACGGFAEASNAAGGGALLRVGFGEASRP
jgi:two-component system sensor histidine kinase MprB